MTSQLSVGSNLPDLPLAELTETTHGRPRVVAFVRGWRLGDEDAQHVHAVRLRVNELDAELVVWSPGGVWSFRPEDETARYSERLIGEVATTAMLFGVEGEGDAVFVLDGRSVVRFAYRAEGGLTATIAVALDAAAEALATRERHDKLARVLFTRREWAVAALVVGCTLSFRGEATAKERGARGEVLGTAFARIENRRLARGSGAIPKFDEVAGPPRPRIPLPPLPSPPTRKP
jgi:hypothetical protein